MENNSKRSFISIDAYEKYYPIIISITLTSIIELLKYLFKVVINYKDTNGVALKDAYPMSIIVCIFICIVLFIISFLIVIIINKRIRTIIYNTPSEEIYMKESFLRLKELGLLRQKELSPDSSQGLSNHLEFFISTHQKCIGLVVSSCYEFFKESFSKKGSLQKDLNFEVSFMTKSYQDGKITIVASDNDKHRRPPSMEQRKTNPNIYDKSETAELYTRYKANPSEALAIHIEEDCTNPNAFVSLYEGQMEKIKSIAVLPVLSPDNVLLGTLVVCANKTSFFKKKDSSFWNELLEIYSVELGYHFLALDYCISCGEKVLPDSLKKPF